MQSACAAAAAPTNDVLIIWLIHLPISRILAMWPKQWCNVIDDAMTMYDHIYDHLQLAASLQHLTAGKLLYLPLAPRYGVAHGHHSRPCAAPCLGIWLHPARSQFHSHAGHLPSAVKPALSCSVLNLRSWNGFCSSPFSTHILNANFG